MKARKARTLDLPVNCTLLLTGAVGILLVLVSSILQTYSFKHITDVARTQSEFYRFYIYAQQQSVLSQNTILLMQANLSLQPMAKEQYQHSLALSQQAAALDCNDVVHLSSLVLGPHRMHQLFKLLGPESMQNNTPPIFSLPTLMLTDATFEEMDREMLLVREKRDAAQRNVFVAYLFGSVLALAGGLRRKDGHWSRVTMLKWAGGSVFLLSWALQGLIVDSVDSRSEYVREISFRAAQLHNANCLYMQSIEVIRRCQSDRGVNGDSMANISSYLVFHAKHSNTYLYSSLGSVAPKELVAEYNEIQTFPDLHGGSFVLADYLNRTFAFQSKCMDLLERKVVRWFAYRSFPGYCLTGLGTIAAALFIWAQLSSIREEKATK